MAAKEELLALAERVEGLSGADFAIEQQIGGAVFGPQSYLFPAFTASLDAAMGLVPDGCRIQLADWDHDTLRKLGPWQAIITPEGGRSRPFPAELGRCEHGATPALALTVAALRARAEGASR